MAQPEHLLMFKTFKNIFMGHPRIFRSEKQIFKLLIFGIFLYFSTFSKNPDWGEVGSALPSALMHVMS
jgi:hypothetical protein